MFNSFCKKNKIKNKHFSFHRALLDFPSLAYFRSIKLRPPPSLIGLISILETSKPLNNLHNPLRPAKTLFSLKSRMVQPGKTWQNMACLSVLVFV